MPSVGIGAVVTVAPTDGSAAWPGEPAGVVIAPAREIYGSPGTVRSRYWTVAFDEPAALTAHGPRVPRADLPEEWLRVAGIAVIADEDLPPELRDA
jgi:hypothetical protein